MTVTLRVRCTMIAALALAGCASQAPKLVVEAPRVEPRPPLGAPPGLSFPEPSADGSLSTINSGVDADEAVWHVRSALNVAALACPQATIAQGYNRTLADRKRLFAEAYASEAARLRVADRAASQSALDSHMTRLYNYFAQPNAQAGFCQAAIAVLDELRPRTDAQVKGGAVAALGRLEAPILSFYRDYADYRRALAAWQAGGGTTAARPAAKALALASPTATGRTWRIQLGAFTGRGAAEAAWRRIRGELPSLARYEPHYEAVPGRPELTRLRIGSAKDRAGALALCASAAAGGFDCIPVAG